jgi:lysophospholipase L1-like esterase
LVRGQFLGLVGVLAVLCAVLLVVAALWQGRLPGAGRPLDRPALPPMSASDAPLRLAVFGTSLTAGSQWPEAVAAALERCLGRPMELVRIARPGAGSGWGRRQVPLVVRARPDLVLIEFAINDADLRDGIGRVAAVANHRAILAALAEGLPQARFVLMTMSPAEGLRGLLRPGLARHYAAYQKIAAEAGVGLVDFYPRWRALPRAARRLDDGLHPADAAAQEVIVPVLVPYLAGVAGGTCPCGTPPEDLRAIAFSTLHARVN